MSPRPALQSPQASTLQDTPSTEPCCDMWLKIRPLLGWFQVDPPDGELVCPVIGQPVPGAPRVNFCPSCGAPRRSALWNTHDD